VVIVVVVVVLRNCCCRFKTTEMNSEVVRSEAAKFNFGFVVVVVVVFHQRISWLQCREIVTSCSSSSSHQISRKHESFKLWVWTLFVRLLILPGMLLVGGWKPEKIWRKN
jgi:hypothetical protein